MQGISYSVLEGLRLVADARPAPVGDRRAEPRGEPVGGGARRPLLGLPLGAAIAVGRFPGAAGGDRGAQRADGPAAGGGGPADLPAAVARRAARRARAAVHAAGDGRSRRRCWCCRSSPRSARQSVEDAWREYEEQLRSLGVDGLRARADACSGTSASRCSPRCWRASGARCAEVGAVMIVGGNIDGVTRVMTTTIALETSKGDLPLALGAGHRPDRASCSC